MKILFADVDRIKKESFLDKNVDDNQVRTSMIYVQDTIMKRVLGRCLYDRLEELICNCGIYEDENEHYRHLLDEYIFPVLVWGIQEDIQVPISYKTRNMGVISTGDTNIANSTLNDINYVRTYYQNKVDFYMSRAIDFLKCSKCYPELKCCECDWYKNMLQPKTNLNLVKQETYDRKYIRRHYK